MKVDVEMKSKPSWKRALIDVLLNSATAFFFSMIVGAGVLFGVLLVLDLVDINVTLRVTGAA